MWHPAHLLLCSFTAPPFRWLALRHLDLNFNAISSLDPGCLELMPALEQLRIACNSIESLNAWLYKVGPDK